MSNPTELPDLDKLLTVCRVALVSLAHAAEKYGIYQTDYERFLAVVEEFATRRAQPESEARCVICGSTEARTGTCGSDDPRALCKTPAATLSPLCGAQNAESGAPDKGELLTEAQREAITMALRKAWPAGFKDTPAKAMGQLVWEVETACIVAAAQSQGAQATMRKCSKFGHRCNCATDCDPDNPHSSVAAHPAAAPSALHASIMNLPAQVERTVFANWSRAEQTAYNAGHRDARHAAAELALTATPSAPGTPEAPSQFERGYFCAVSALLNEDGDSTYARSIFRQGGDPSKADPLDIERFIEHGLMPRAAQLDGGQEGSGS